MSIGISLTSLLGEPVDITLEWLWSLLTKPELYLYQQELELDISSLSFKELHFADISTHSQV